MSIWEFTGQLAARLLVVGALLAAAGITSYEATHWEPRTSTADAPSLTPPPLARP